mmetsp:Transcript_31385/g.57626  ORF Transcript_31385/g.57626 Transcript_31385/m.57626 type:complete len:275 (-) Transcript_31385:160-984(-)
MQRKQVAVVTGGNRGIGLEIARQCTAAGFQVILTARDEAKGQGAAKSLGCDFALLDLDDPASIKQCAGDVQKKYGHVDVLINNASFAYKHADQTPWTVKARTTVATNFFGTLCVMEAFVPLLRPGARVVTVASSSGHLNLVPGTDLRQELASADTTLTVQRLSELMASFVAAVEESKSSASAPGSSWPHVAKGWPNSAYGMSKLGQIALTKIYARMLQQSGIGVNCCCPGSVATGMNPGGSRTPSQGADTPVWLACQSSQVTGQFFMDRRSIRW